MNIATDFPRVLICRNCTNNLTIQSEITEELCGECQKRQLDTDYHWECSICHRLLSHTEDYCYHCETENQKD
jgi:hypothetical protein